MSGLLKTEESYDDDDVSAWCKDWYWLNVDYGMRNTEATAKMVKSAVCRDNKILL
jgi:hypothetical protein